MLRRRMISTSSNKSIGTYSKDNVRLEQFKISNCVYEMEYYAHHTISYLH